MFTVTHIFSAVSDSALDHAESAVTGKLCQPAEAVAQTEERFRDLFSEGSLFPAYFLSLHCHICAAIQKCQSCGNPLRRHRSYGRRVQHETERSF